MSNSIHEPLIALTALPQIRPPGLIEGMHYGFDLRCGGYRDSAHGADEWRGLDETEATLEARQLEQILPVLEARAWEAGSHLAVRLAIKLWPQLSSEAQGRFLGGVSRHLSGPGRHQKSPAQEENKLVDFMLAQVPSASLDAQAAAEIAANAIRAKQLSILEAVLAHPQFDPEAQVERIAMEDQNHRFAAQISQHATRSLDVLLECAVRCLRPAAAERLLRLGANPDLPCWNLERSFNEWFSLLSYALSALWTSKDSAAAERLVDLVLEHGANPQGLPCEGLNHPLKLALDNRRWDIADRLLDLGASFNDGKNLTPEDFEKPGKLIPAGHPHFDVGDEDLTWVEEKIAPLMPLFKPWQEALFYRGDGQGGSSSTFLSSLLAEEHLEQLKHFESRGLPTRLTPSQLIKAVNGGHYAALLHLLREEPNLPRLMFRIRRRNPEIGTSDLQAWLCQPQEDRVNELPEFDPGDQDPLVLPDGSRFYFFLDVVAPADHHHGPVTSGCFWLELHHAEHRRRRDRVLVRRLKRTWRMNAIPSNDYQINDMIPIVKEVKGRFFLLGIISDDMQFNQHFPVSWKPLVNAWLEQPLERVKKQFRQRIVDQLATTPPQPDLVLSAEELEPYPKEFWPWLRRLPDGFIGMTAESCRKCPDMLDIYTVWERQNKPPRDFKPDPRVAAWVLWPEIPPELRPFFVWDNVFKKPCVTYKSRNDYEHAMIRKAVNWNNAQFTKAFENGIEDRGEAQ